MPQRATLKLDLGPVEAKLREADIVGLNLALEHGLQVSRTQVPHEEGTLERSGTVSVDEANRIGAVSYDTEYATRQHEDLTLKHDEGRKAKYLEDPWDSEAAVMLEIMAAQRRRALS